MIRNILVAVDGSESSLGAMRLAADWAAALPAQLRAVFVEEEQRFLTYAVSTSMAGEVPIPVPLAPEKMAQEKRRVAEERAAIEQAFKKATERQVPNAQFKSVPGATNSVLIGEARGADLVAIGKRGHFEPVEMRQAGPTTETVIYDCLRPVVVVPDQARTEGPLLVAFDDSAGVQRVLPFAMEIAGRMGMPITVLTVTDKPERAGQLQDMMKSYLRGHSSPVRYVAERGNAAQTILQAAETERAGLIAMGAFGRNPIYQLFFGSVTRSVLERSSCPLLLMA